MEASWVNRGHNRLPPPGIIMTTSRGQHLLSPFSCFLLRWWWWLVTKECHHLQVLMPCEADPSDNTAITIRAQRLGGHRHRHTVLGEDGPCLIMYVVGWKRLDAPRQKELIKEGPPSNHGSYGMMIPVPPVCQAGWYVGHGSTKGQRWVPSIPVDGQSNDEPAWRAPPPHLIRSSLIEDTPAPHPSTGIITNFIHSTSLPATTTTTAVRNGGGRICVSFYLSDPRVKWLLLVPPS